MRRLAVLVFVAACRVGFDQVPADGTLTSCSTDADCGRCQRCEQGMCNRATFTDVDLDYRNGCALDERGELWCWGQNEYLIIDPRTFDGEVVPRPRRVPQPESLASIAIGRGAGMLLAASRRVSSIGTAGGDVNDPRTTWRSIAASNFNACALDDDDTAWCAGIDDNGQLGRSVTNPSAQPLAQWGGSGWLKIAPGSTTCAIDDSERLFCVGANSGGELGRGQTSPYELDIAEVETAMDWTAVSIGEYFVCGLRGSGSLFCWGAGAGGNTTLPAQISPDTGWSELDAVFRAACALRGTQLYCVASDSPMVAALIGTASTLNNEWQMMPITVDPGTSPVIGGHSACVKQGGAWVCWGDNTLGAVGVDALASVGPTPLCE